MPTVDADLPHNNDGTNNSNNANTNIINSIQNVRKNFLLHHQANSDLYDVCDVDNVRTCDWTVKRFLLSHGGDEELALKSLCEAMKWRKSFGVNHRDETYFPDDFFKIGGLFEYNCDKDGTPLLYFRVCVHHKVNELVDYVRQFFVYNVNRIDQMTGERKWAMVFDSSNAGLSNVDMDMSKYMIHVLQNYFPKGYKYVLIYEMPWIMVAFWKITRNWLSEEVRTLIQFANRNEIFNYIDAENVPTYINGGKCLKSIHYVPDEVKPAEELPHLGFTKAQIERFRVIFKDALEKADVEKSSKQFDDTNSCHKNPSLEDDHFNNQETQNEEINDSNPPSI